MKKKLVFILCFTINIFANSDKIVKYNVMAFPLTMNPQLATDSSSGEILAYIFEGLTRQDSKGKPEPAIAESWEYRDNIWTFKLRKTAKWHNGDLVTAKDFLDAWERVLNPNNRSEYSSIMYCIKGAEEYNNGTYKDFSSVGVKALDNFTLEVTLKEPTMYFPSLVSHCTFYPQNTRFINKIGYEAYGKWEDTILGNGPYKLTYSDKINGLICEKAQNYWNKDSIKIDVIEFSLFDRYTAYEKYKEGLLDIVNFYDKNSKDLKTFEDGTVWYIAFNENNKLFTNKKIRKAISMAIDRKTFMNDVKGNLGTIAESFVPNGIVGKTDFFREENNQMTYGISYHPVEAKKLFEEGLKELNLKISDIEPVYLLTGNNEIVASESNFYVNQIKNVLDLNILIEPVDFETRLKRTSARAYDMVLSGWGADYNDPMTFLDLWTSNSSQNNTDWKNKEYDDLIAKAKAEINYNARIDILSSAEKLLMEELPIIPIFYRKRALLVNPNINNIYFSPFTPSVNLINSEMIDFNYSKKNNDFYRSANYFLENIINFNTENYKVRIDWIGNDRIRLALWKAQESYSSKPIVIINNGTAESDYEGRYFTFQSKENNYKIFVDNTDEGFSYILNVYKGNRLLISEQSFHQ